MIMQLTGMALAAIERAKAALEAKKASIETELESHKVEAGIVEAYERLKLRLEEEERNAAGAAKVIMERAGEPDLDWWAKNLSNDFERFFIPMTQEFAAREFCKKYGGQMEDAFKRVLVDPLRKEIQKFQEENREVLTRYGSL